MKFNSKSRLQAQIELLSETPRETKLKFRSIDRGIERRKI